MSVQALTFVFGMRKGGEWLLDPVVTPNAGARCVLLALANYADEIGESWPAMDTLAKHAGMSPGQCRRHVAALVDAGVIKVVEKGAPDDRIPPRYRPNLYRISGLASMQGLTDSAPASTHFSPGVDADSAPAPTTGNPSIDPSVIHQGAQQTLRPREGLFDSVDWKPTSRQRSKAQRAHNLTDLELDRIVASVNVEEDLTNKQAVRRFADLARWAGDKTRKPRESVGDRLRREDATRGSGS